MMITVLTITVTTTARDTEIMTETIAHRDRRRGMEIMTETTVRRDRRRDTEILTETTARPDHLQTVTTGTRDGSMTATMTEITVIEITTEDRVLTMSARTTENITTETKQIKPGRNAGFFHA